MYIVFSSLYTGNDISLLNNTFNISAIIDVNEYTITTKIQRKQQMPTVHNNNKSPIMAITLTITINYLFMRYIRQPNAIQRLRCMIGKKGFPNICTLPHFWILQQSTNRKSEIKNWKWKILLKLKFTYATILWCCKSPLYLHHSFFYKTVFVHIIHLHNSHTSTTLAP